MWGSACAVQGLCKSEGVEPIEPPRVLCTPGFLGSDRLIGSLVGIVAVFGFGWCGAAEAVHEPLVVEPVDPVSGDVLDVGEGTQRATSEW